MRITSDNEQRDFLDDALPVPHQRFFILAFFAEKFVSHKYDAENVFIFVS